MLSSAVREASGRAERAGSVRGPSGWPELVVDDRTVSGRTTNDRTTNDRAGGERYAGAGEPLLADLLSDPLTHSVMASDGVKHRHLMLVIAEVQARLNGA
ncbi:MAG: hypothetical protein H7840_03965 [Alphaproteobacteria bacterium]